MTARHAITALPTSDASILLPDTSEAVVVINTRNRILAVNPAFTRITGYAASAFVGHSPQRLFAEQSSPAWGRAWCQAIAHCGSWTGELHFRREDGQIYLGQLQVQSCRNSQGELTHYVAIHSDLTQRRIEEALIRQLTEHDPLTGLPNWERFQSKLEICVNHARNGTAVALLMMDLDRFRSINESLGHHMGDYVLQALAERIVRMSPHASMVARRGGDEYCLVCEMRSLEEALLELPQLAASLLTAIAEPVHLYGQAFAVTASIGISLYPQDGQNAASLLRYADAATDQAKREGRNTWRFFTPALKEAIDVRRLLERGLHRAIDGMELSLDYQPLIDLNNGQVTGVEALLRWRHPELGHVSPDRFIPLAEENGTIVAIGEWVLREACRQGRSWHDAGHRRLQIAVNLSPLQFKHHALAERIIAILDHSGFNPACLDLEITEGALMQEPEKAARLLSRLKQQQIRISVDDFGTGYSSLGYLKHFPLDRLKIDRSFVESCHRDSHDAAIVDTVINLAHNMALEVLAEGVETDDQLRFLQQRGCEVAQGYLFSPPCPASQITLLLTRENWLHCPA